MEPLYVTRIAQYQAEVEWFKNLIRENGVKSYLEIGARHGGSLWQYGRAMPVGSRIVAVDLPLHRETLDSLRQCATELTKLGYDVHLVIGNSHDENIIDAARALGPFDLVLIDADHVLEAVRKDWANYSPMARMIALHDINWKPPKGWVDWKDGRPINCPEFWEEIKPQYARTEEARLDPTGQNNGIGVAWRQ